MVPNHHHHHADAGTAAAAFIYSSSGSGSDAFSKKHRALSPSCGKQRQVILKQLMGLLETDMVDADGGGGGGGGGGEGGGDDLGPDTPNGSGGCGVWPGNEDVGGGLGNEDVADIVSQQFQPQEQQNAPFLSLLMMQTPGNPEDKDRIIQGNMWNNGACGQSTQVTLNAYNLLIPLIINVSLDWLQGFIKFLSLFHLLFFNSTFELGNFFALFCTRIYWQYLFPFRVDCLQDVNLFGM